VLTRFPDDGSANFCTLVTFQRKTHFTCHHRNGDTELSHSADLHPLPSAVGVVTVVEDIIHSYSTTDHMQVLHRNIKQ